MYLLNTETLRLESTDIIDVTGEVEYAILSHRWDYVNEVRYGDVTGNDDDIDRKMRSKLGFAKVEGACEQAKRDGLKHIWIDTCCIDKSSSAELSEAINSMYRQVLCLEVRVFRTAQLIYKVT